MICLYAKNETDFSTNGLKVLQPVECTVVEEINFDFSLQITMPQGDTSIHEEMIIKASTPKGDQLFRVYKPQIDVFGNNVYQARHITYDMLDDFIEDKRPSGNGQAAIDAILAGTGFTGTSDITDISSAEYQMMNPVKALLGGQEDNDNAFKNRWGGEIERDNFTIRMNRRVGADRGVTIRYRKNLIGLTMETDVSDVVTRIYPTGRKADGQTLLTLPEKYVDSPLIENYVHPKILRYDYSDIQIVDKTDDSHPQIVTEAQAYDQLRAAAAADFKAGIDKPSLCAEVEFIPLEATEEYKNYAVLEKVYIGDTVHVFHEPLGIELSAEVMSYEYDSILRRYNKITLGSVAQMVGSVQSTIGKIATGAQSSADNAQKSADEANASIEVLDGQIVLKADKGSLVAEINVSPETIKISANKLELSGLVTIESAENGDTTINGKCIKTGRIESEDGGWWLDLETGKFYLKNGTFAGDVVWTDENNNKIGSITCGGQAGLVISGSKISVESPDLSLNAQDSSSVFIKNLDIGDNVSIGGKMGISRSIPVRNYEDTGTRRLVFQNGYCIGVEDD